MADLERKRSPSPNTIEDVVAKKPKINSLYKSRKKKTPGFSNDIFNETSYCIENGN